MPTSPGRRYAEVEIAQRIEKLTFAICVVYPSTSIVTKAQLIDHGLSGVRGLLSNKSRTRAVQIHVRIDPLPRRLPMRRSPVGCGGRPQEIVLMQRGRFKRFLVWVFWQRAVSGGNTIIINTNGGSSGTREAYLRSNNYMKKS